MTHPYTHTVTLYDREDHCVYEGYLAGTYEECKAVGRLLLKEGRIEGAVRSKPLMIDR